MTNNDIALKNSNGSPNLDAGSQDRGVGSGVRLNLTYERVFPGRHYHYRANMNDDLLEMLM